MAPITIKTLLHGALRSGATVAVLAGMVWLGEAFGPQRAQAEVFRMLNTDRLTVPWLYDVGLVFDRAGRTPRRLAGLPAGYREAHWRGSSDALLKRLRATAARAESHNREERTGPRWFQAAGTGWIAFGQDPSSEDSGGGFVLFALDAQQGRGRHCTVSLWELEQSPRGRDLWADSKSVVSAADLIEHYPGSVPVFELSRSEAAGATRVVAGYRGRGTIAGHRHHYNAVFRQAGLELQPGDTGEAREPVLLRYSGQGAEATVSISPASSPAGGIVDIVHLRLAHNRRT